ncbi:MULTISPECIES: hypothetical protein [Croceibacter]|mgnify:FL=1|jgi:hypothetical protein|uniref:Uncharacterized protein n=1 Tax=Croceibacter atlanticus (strain ATCC BAA-628 / JCM 21780 / CIP 108009 / IAM 15332 / KCTC 12090 / HTCC2559) TaxID=216432 RepID=A3U4G5_CROAH|nr:MULTISPECIES: hypothetical protein [Croceibacter]EAP87132.1 hypothetical protein CA2559_00215 [Croceibacter atlanticus HTCC2559]WSP34764.1 hypothetical protein VVL01_01550 [Croceibacter atlanticus]|tara:strand:+ start:1324 stop:1455 length:132 start_codon:yes stop_codon:yes gene_type:complete
MSNGNDRNVKNEKGHSTPRDSKNMHSEEDNSTSDGLKISNEEE